MKQKVTNVLKKSNNKNNNNRGLEILGKIAKK